MSSVNKFQKSAIEYIVRTKELTNFKKALMKQTNLK